MARITHVKKAQQRYATVPELDADGQPVRIQLTNKDGSPKMTRAKGGRPSRPIFITKTVSDKSQPLPELRCDYSGCQINGGRIAVGSAYKHIKPKSGPYGGRQLNRHEEHPSWQVWEYSNSLSAQVARISHDFWDELGSPESEDDVQAALDSAADQVEEIAEQKRESAENIREGFGHDTYQSEELDQVAEELESWAEEIRGADIPEPPSDDDFDDTPEDWDEEDGEPSDSEKVNSDGETYDEALDAWRDEVNDAVSIVDECPV